MPGEIDEESIIENKGAIKNYWETKMRENAASQFARSNFGGSGGGGGPSTTIIDKINEEIREDYIRNLELMNDEGLPRSSASDISDDVIDFDSFDLASSNGSSPFGKPLHASSPVLADSPALIDSGHQSQESNHPLTESEHVESPVVHSEIYEVDSPARSDYSASPEPNVHHEEEVVKDEPPIEPAVKKTPVAAPKSPVAATNGVSTYRGPFSTPPKSGGGKIENSVTHFLQFNKTFKRSTSSVSEEEPKPVVKKAQEASPPPLKPSTKADDISYRIATSRLKKEIEDNLRREQELKEEGRVKTLSVDTVSPPEQRIQTRPAALAAPKPPAADQKPVVEAVKLPEVPKEASPEPKPVVAAAKPEPEVPAVEEPVEAEVPAAVAAVEPEPPKRPTHSSLYTPRPFAQPLTRAQQQQQAPNLSFKLGKNFTSLERYIMYSSLTKLNYRSMPPAWNKSASQEVLNNNSNSNVKFEIQEEEKDQDEPEKVRKYYIPAEKKIQEELQEMQEREAELKRTRGQWKSTPNLTSLDEEETAEQPKTQEEPQFQPEPTKEETPEPESQPEVTMRQSPGRRNTDVRRRSALISKWEDMISKHNNS